MPKNLTNIFFVKNIIIIFIIMSFSQGLNGIGNKITGYFSSVSLSGQYGI